MREETLSEGVEQTKKPLLTVADLAAELGINERTATAIVRRGQIPIVKVNDRVRVSRVALNKWLQGTTTTTA
jgi:excisionase family DNA binding protein